MRWGFYLFAVFWSLFNRGLIGQAFIIGLEFREASFVDYQKQSTFGECYGEQRRGDTRRWGSLNSFFHARANMIVVFFSRVS